LFPADLFPTLLEFASKREPHIKAGKNQDSELVITYSVSASDTSDYSDNDPPPFVTTSEDLWDLGNVGEAWTHIAPS
jgi:hypothetical protein